MNGEVDSLENLSRCNNLIFEERLIIRSGLTQRKMSEKSSQKKLKLDHKHMQLEHAHHSGKLPGQGKPRPIVVMFLRYKYGLAVLEKVKHLKGKYNFVNEDFLTNYVIKC